MVFRIIHRILLHISVFAFLFVAVCIAVLWITPYYNRLANERNALSGDIAAAQHEGYCYEIGGARVFGYGRFAANRDRAAYWYLIAARTRDANSAYDLARLYERRFAPGRDNDALRWYVVAAQQQKYEAMERLVDVYSNGELSQAPDRKKAVWWRRMAQTHNGLTGLCHRSEDLDRRKTRFHKIEKQIDTGTDRGGALTGYMEGQDLKIVELEFGLSNKDVVDDFYFQNGTLFFVKEVVRSFPYIAKNNAIDFSTPIRETEVDTGYLITGKFVGDNTPNPPDDEKQPSAARAERLCSLASRCASALRSRDTEIDAESWK